MPSGNDRMGGYRFSEEIMLKQKTSRERWRTAPIRPAPTTSAEAP
jgi:hypothetical protein